MKTCAAAIPSAFENLYTAVVVSCRVEQENAR